MKVYQLVCESILNCCGPMVGGPMAMSNTDSPTHIFSKPFISLDNAKKYASKKVKNSKIEWEENDLKILSGESMGYIFSITEEKI